MKDYINRNKLNRKLLILIDAVLLFIVFGYVEGC